MECAERGLDPLDALLVVADESRTAKTICLAVSPALKALGVPGRARLFEARQIAERENRARQKRAPGGRFTGASASAAALKAEPSLQLDFIAAVPRMAYYMEYSRKIVDIYLQYVSYDDLLVYSIDEVFIDATPYLRTYRTNARDFAMTLIRRVLKETGITATAGIGTNLYLSKAAMDIVAKHIPADRDGVRIAQLNEMSYREQLWLHTPLTDFWRVGRGTARKLEQYGMRTMGDVARCSEKNARLLYKLFGVNAELLIDHAWGWEPTEISDCKAFTPESRSLSMGQVLPCPYPAQKGRIVVQEMADQLAMELVEKGLLADQVVLDVNYDVSNLDDPAIAAKYKNDIKEDYYGRPAPKRAHGSQNLEKHVSSSAMITRAAREIYDRIVDPALTVRRFNLAVAHLLTMDEAREKEAASPPEQLSLFRDHAAEEQREQQENAALEKERKMQETLLLLRDKFGKNAVVKGLNLQEGATAMDRNGQIGGHKK